MDVLYKGVTGPVTITDTGKKTKVGCVCGLSSVFNVLHLILVCVCVWVCPGTR